jgi:cyclase
MLKTRVIPCLLVKNGGLVKTKQFKDPKYVGDPINAIKIFNAKEVDELILLDITATLEKRGPDMKMISQIVSECFMPLGYGGGIRNIEEMKEIFNLGAEKIIINSYAVENPEIIQRASRIFGSQSIIVSIDVKKSKSGKYEILIYGGTISAKMEIEDFVIKMEKMGAGEIFLNSMDNDGMMGGYDLELIKKVSRCLTIPVIVSGGAGKMEHFKDAIENGASSVAAGSMFVFYGKNRAVLISYPDRKEIEALNLN